MAAHVETQVLVPAFMLKRAQIDCFLIPNRGSQLHQCKSHNCQLAREHTSCQDVGRVHRVCVCAIRLAAMGMTAGTSAGTTVPSESSWKEEEEERVFSLDGIAR